MLRQLLPKAKSKHVISKSPVSLPTEQGENTTGTLVTNATESKRSPLTRKENTESKRSPLSRKESTHSNEKGVEKPSTLSLSAAASKTDRRTDDGCFVPLRTPAKKADGTFARPCGRAPPGMAWDPVRGLYVPESKGSVTTTASSQSNAQVGTMVSTCSKTSGCEENPSTRNGQVSISECYKYQQAVGCRVVTAPGSSNSGQRRPRGSRAERDADIKKRTTKDGCLIPKTAPKRKADGTFARPSGRCPPGMIWDPVRGLYVPKSKLKSKPTTAVPVVDSESND